MRTARSTRRPTHPVWAVLVALLLACAVVGPPVALADEPAAATATAAPAADVDAQLKTVDQAFGLLVDVYVHPVDASALLGAGWERMTKDATAAGGPPPEPAPAFSGARQADLEALHAALRAYLAQPHPLLPGFSPGYSFVRGMVGFVNEGHTYFLDPQQYREYQDWTRGQRHYIGIGVGLNTRGPEPTITEVYEDTPAAQAGLRQGDVLVQIDNHALAGLPGAEVTGYMRGAVDTPVRLTVRRAGAADPLTFTLTRADIHLAFVTHRLVADDVGYIQLRGFPEPSVIDNVEQAVDEFRQQGVQGLVLDLRGNSGGRIDVGSRLLGHFVPPGTALFEEVDRAGNETMHKSRAGTLYGWPLVVLVDGGTASMGELFASVVQEQGVGTVLGTVTSGSVAGSQVYPLGDGSGLQVTVFDIRAADGKLLNGVGVVPDETVESDPVAVAAGGDPVLDRALDIVRAKIDQAPSALRLPLAA
jgi:carboxyl-terminal processing protease